MRLLGKGVLVTGAQQGIGRATCRARPAWSASRVRWHSSSRPTRFANAIAPGLTDTAQPRHGHTETELVDMARQVPLGHMGAPEDVSATAVFLASDDARHITGQVIHVNGGSYLG